jgi:hypothetical protein
LNVNIKLAPLIVAFLFSMSGAPCGHAAELGLAPTALVRAHAHNDYEHARPLFDALDQGFCSVEADIYLVEGQLLVAHDRNKVRSERTLQALYLEPLRQRVQQNGGRLYKDGPPAILLIDVKSDAEATYKVLGEVLRLYADILTRFTAQTVETNAITAVISGNRAQKLLADEPTRYAALDGRPEDLEGAASKALIPLVSEDWNHLFKWQGIGRFPEAEKKRLQEFVHKAHEQGRRTRFWGTADQPTIWGEQLAAGVDLLNADDLSGLRQFLMRQQPIGSQ